jgi:hypothetical protein
MSATKRRFVYLVAAVTMGFLGANGFADAVGISPIGPNSYNNEGVIFLRILCGLIVGLGTLALLSVLRHYTGVLVDFLRETPHRPNPAVAVLLILCGMLCLVMTMGFAWYLASGTQTIHPNFMAGGDRGPALMQVQIPRDMGDVSVGVGGGIVVHRGASLVAQVLAIGIFLTGIVLLTIGVWGSLSGGKSPGGGPRETPVTAQVVEDPPPHAQAV